MGAATHVKLEDAFRDVGELARISERRTCILAVLAEARDYHARATDLRSVDPDSKEAWELESISLALHKLANVMEGLS
jgi:hypothetical protein